MTQTNYSDRALYLGLTGQLDKLAKHNRQGSYRTQERYYRAMRQFCRFLAETYHLQKLTNISGDHLVAYVEYMREEGLSTSTIKTSLSAIRFFHDKMDRPRCSLPPNSELGVTLERRRFGGVDRTWTQEEFGRMLLLAEGHHPEYVFAFYMARYVGLRLHEVFHIDTAIAERMLREGQITIKGKGGKVRTVPIDPKHRNQIELATKRLLAVTPRGHKLLVPAGIKTHNTMNALEQYIYRHRSEAEKEGRAVPLIFHGLRHTYATLSIKSGDDIKTVQENLGHATAAFTLDVYGHVTAQMHKDSEQVIKSVSGS